MTAAILPQLRTATAAAHNRLETTLGLLDPILDRQRYIWIIGRFHGFWRNWQPLVASRLADEAFTRPRQRLHLLTADLAALGMSDAAIAALPACPPPDLTTPSEALGSLYVLEGSTLGGRLILATIAPRLNLTPTSGCAYFAGYGAETVPQWRAFQTRLTTIPASDADQLIAGAQATFARLTDWVRSA